MVNYRRAGWIRRSASPEPRSFPWGTAAACETWHLANTLAEGAAAAMYVVSHHTVRENELPMDVFIELCREHGVPVIVDMATEYDLTGPIALGAAAAIYSGHKFLSGVTSGIVAGTSDLIRATYLQHRGIGRTMKAGKESVVGAMAALENWEKRDHGFARRAEEARVALWMRELADIPGLSLAPHADWTGNPITRVRIAVAPESAGFHAWALAGRLAARTPRILVRDDLIERQEFYLDPCNLTDEEAAACRRRNPGRSRAVQGKRRRLPRELERHQARTRGGDPVMVGGSQCFLTAGVS